MRSRVFRIDFFNDIFRHIFISFFAGALERGGAHHHAHHAHRAHRAHAHARRAHAHAHAHRARGRVHRHGTHHRRHPPKSRRHHLLGADALHVVELDVDVVAFKRVQILGFGSGVASDGKRVIARPVTLFRVVE